MPRPIAYAICVSLLVAFVYLAVVPIVGEVLRRMSSGNFVPAVTLDASRIEDRRHLGPDPQALFQLRWKPVIAATVEALARQERQDEYARSLATVR